MAVTACPTCGTGFETTRGMRVHHTKSHDRSITIDEWDVVVHHDDFDLVGVIHDVHDDGTVEITTAGFDYHTWDESEYAHRDDLLPAILELATDGTIESVDLVTGDPTANTGAEESSLGGTISARAQQFGDT